MKAGPRLPRRSRGTCKEPGIDEVIVYCVDDGALMHVWEKDQSSEGTMMITMFADPVKLLVWNLQQTVHLPRLFSVVPSVLL